MMVVLEAVGEAGIDIVPRVFDRFFERYPETREMFPNLPAAAGRMVNETIEALVGIAEGAWWVETTIVNFVDLHRNYGAITIDHYAGWGDITVAVLLDAAGDGSAAAEAAWQRQAVRLKEMIAIEAQASAAFG